MENNDLEPAAAESSSADDSVVGLAVDRSIGRRRANAQAEIERLVGAALAVIRRTGRLEPTVSNILAEAGLSNQAFYRHFRSKHELLVAVLDQGIRGLATYLSGRMAAAESPGAAIREWIRGLAAQAGDPGGAQATRPFVLARAKLAEAFPSEVARSAAQITAPLRASLEQARHDGEMPAVDPVRDAEMLYLLMMGWLEARLLDGRIPEQVEVIRLEAFILAGLSRRLES
jgi:AcrR family transcriptional regulator